MAVRQESDRIIVYNHVDLYVIGNSASAMRARDLAANDLRVGASLRLIQRCSSIARVIVRYY